MAIIRIDAPGCAVLLACKLSSNLGSATPEPAGSSNPVSPTPGPTGSSNAYQYIFETPTDPISLTVSLDSSASAEAVIPVQGGSLSATGTDGTIYNLEIPGDALQNDTKIRMTPASSVAGLPFGGKQAYVVQLAPEGLSIFNFATLTIAPAQAIPLDQQITFGYKASGKDFGLAAPVVDSKDIKIRLLHFSGYGVTQGFLADIEPVRQRLGGDADSRLQSLARATIRSSPETWITCSSSSKPRLCSRGRLQPANPA